MSVLGAVREEGGEIVVVGCEKKQDGDGGDESDGGLGAAHARAGEGEVGGGVLLREGKTETWMLLICRGRKERL